MSTTMTTTNQFRNGSDQQLTRKNGAGEHSDSPMFAPRIDTWEGDNALILYCNLPGVDPDHLSIQFENRQLTLRGKVCRRPNGSEHSHSEYGVGDFHRSFMIGESIDTDAISAELKDGVLTLYLPKVEEAKPRRIEIKAN